jgi:D-alanyl-lipoteichoic acid acyltransferase DltB (MBOAT superfamily)
MLFNSLIFALFLPVVFSLYWVAGSSRRRLQNAILLIASYVFYGWWDYRFLALILFSSAVDYMVGVALGATNHKRCRLFLVSLSLCLNLCLLGFFKYFNFFIDSLEGSLTAFGFEAIPLRLNIILPVGISFYTFQTLSYSLDVYRRKISPTRDIVAFFTFVSFFPQLVAGPIERASNLLPQFTNSRRFDEDAAVDGFRQMLWGYFKKMVVADGCAATVNQFFSNPSEYSASSLLLGAVLFSFQIYGDFSGYSDIAIGTARLFGFSLSQNFAYPYFSSNVIQFWKRWHISLSTWFRDYLYIPMGGGYASGWRFFRNIIVVFLVSGLWHGANWTFLLWGLFHAMIFIASKLWLGSGTCSFLKKLFGKSDIGCWFWSFVTISTTYCLVSFAWILFRSESISDALIYYKCLFSGSILSLPSLIPKKSILAILFMLLVEWVQRKQRHGLAIDRLIQCRWQRWSIYYFILLLIILFYSEGHSFVYFQF